MSQFFRKLGHNNVKNVILRHNEAQVFVVACRKFSVVPSLYGNYVNTNSNQNIYRRIQILCSISLCTDGEQDPAPKFFSSNVQVLLKRLTRPDFSKVFRKRTNSGLPVLKTPNYKFLTTEELDAEIAKANLTAERLLQMPPVVKVSYKLFKTTHLHYFRK